MAGLLEVLSVCRLLGGVTGVLQAMGCYVGFLLGFNMGFTWILHRCYIGVTVTLGVLQGYITVVYQGQYSCVGGMVNDTRVY